MCGRFTLVMQATRAEAISQAALSLASFREMRQKCLSSTGEADQLHREPMSLRSRGPQMASTPFVGDPQRGGNRKNAVQLAASMESQLVTDSRGLYDAVSSHCLEWRIVAPKWSTESSSRRRAVLLLMGSFLYQSGRLTGQSNVGYLQGRGHLLGKEHSNDCAKHVNSQRLLLQRR